MSRHDETPSWVDAPKSEAGKILVQYARHIETRLETRITNWELYGAMYSEQLTANMRPSRTRWLTQQNGVRNANLSFNVGRSLCDTEHAEVTAADPRPTVLTENGNRPQQDKAIELQRAIDGIMSEQRGYDTLAQCELDKCVFGTGVAKVYRFGIRPMIDRVLISEILVDEDLMAAGRDPPQIIHRIETSRAAALVWMKDQPPRVLQAIKDAPSLAVSGLAGRRLDLIVLYDAYSIAYDNNHPGRHAMAVENFDEPIFTEEWTKPRLPFVFQRWQRPRTGFYGVGIIEQVLGIQLDINRFLRTVSAALKRWGVPTAMLPFGAKIDVNLFRNDPRGNFIPYDGAGGGVPTFWNQNILTPEVMQFLQFQMDNAYKVTGIPQNVAFAQREPGIVSAAGQQQITEKAASRLGPQSKQYDRAFIDIAWLLDDVIREIKKDGGKMEISSSDDGALHKVDIDRAISLEPGSYKFDIFAGNLLSRHPATKFDQVERMTNSGILDKAEGRKLISMPDVTAALGRQSDSQGIYQRQIENALRHGLYQPPEEYWPDKELGVKLYANALFAALDENVPDEKLQVLRDWLTSMKDIMSQPNETLTSSQPTAPPDVPALPQIQTQPGASTQ